MHMCGAREPFQAKTMFNTPLLINSHPDPCQWLFILHLLQLAATTVKSLQVRRNRYQKLILIAPYLFFSAHTNQPERLAHGPIEFQWASTYGLATC